ncbi:glycosyltransferase family 9 protein [Hymenobacter sp. UV11]|uniref:glycosyltransferase family 9 protein n=1 Tax=Hymenobacter sp. UV11 TaxID=1849735 RepID=UPI0010616831|nr:glycosyltransferase family 9 protein [Hymenobacter sp. UV11]TDN40640.1 heptosyltransferase [Hymenobacter sp. UV11]TFZ66461.1 glycosyltransferase family 9 protein [Hymenobacter sp. UV11]
MPAFAPATLLIQTAFIGDVILATALVEYLAAHEPGAPLDVLVRRGNEGLLAGNPHIRRVLIWDKKDKKYPNLLRLLRQVRQAKYGRVVTLQRFASTGFLTAFSGAAERVGFAENPFSRFFTRREPHVIGDGTHEVERNLSLIKNDKLKSKNEPVGDNNNSIIAGGKGKSFNSSFLIFNSTKPCLYPTPADEAAAAPYAAVGEYICLAPTSVWFTKQYPEEKWLELLAALPPHLPVYLLGGPPDTAACEQLAQAAGRPGLVNLSGKLSLPASAALMRGALLNYVNDSAPLHLCSAVDAPVCAIFCSTVPRFGFGPLSTFSRVVEHPGPLACRPCGLHGHARCPLGHFRCALEIETPQLLAALAEARAWRAEAV